MTASFGVAARTPFVPSVPFVVAEVLASDMIWKFWILEKGMMW